MRLQYYIISKDWRTGAKIINQVSVGKNTTIGAGALVSKSIPANCTAVGIPAKPIKFHS